MIDFSRLIVSTRPVIITFAGADSMQGASTLLKTLREAKPTEFLGVPRIFEKFEELVESQIH